MGVCSVAIQPDGDRDGQANIDLAGQLHFDAVLLDGRFGVEIGRRTGGDVGPAADRRLDADEAGGLDVGHVAGHAVADARGRVVRVQHQRQRERALETCAIDGLL